MRRARQVERRGISAGWLALVVPVTCQWSVPVSIAALEVRRIKAAWWWPVIRIVTIAPRGQTRTHSARPAYETE